MSPLASGFSIISITITCLIVDTQPSFFLSFCGETRNTLQIPNDSCRIVNVFGATLCTVIFRIDIDETTLITQRHENVKCPIIDSQLPCHTNQVIRLLLRHKLFQIEMTSRTTIKPLRIFLSMESQFVDDVIGIVFYREEVAVVTSSWSLQSSFFVPLCVFDTEVFGRDKFSIKLNTCQLLPLFVILIDLLEILRKEGCVGFTSFKLRRFQHPINTNGTKLLV